MKKLNPVDMSREELQSLERLNDLKASINAAHALLLSEEMIFRVDKVSSQGQVDMLTKVCYDAEELVSKVEFKIIKNQWGSTRRSPMFRNMWPMRIRATISKLQRCMESIIKVQTPYSMSSQNNCPPHLCRKCKHVSSLIGRDKEVVAIIMELTSQEKLESVGVSIVGLDGVGKSALAHQILNHDSVAQLYPRRLWISLSGKFDLEEIVNQLVENYSTMVPGYKAKESNCYESLQGLLAVIQDVPWLIVLDNLLDVPSTADWNHFQSSFRPSSRGKIIITTVNHDISSVTETTRYCLHPLSDKHCQEIALRQTGFDDGLVLPAVIDAVAKNCCGLPIIANFIGAHVSIVEDKQGTLLDGELWGVPEFQRQILPTLTATYSMLETHHLRRCFVYLSLFPHDYRHRRDDLIHLWIAEGFIQHQEESSLEHVGLVYFQTLVKWSILQFSHVDLQNQQTFRIHESTHKLAQLMASKTYFCLDQQVKYSGMNTRHLSLKCQYLTPDFLKEIKNLEGIRTFLPLGPISIGISVANLLKRFLYIRVLSLKHSDVDHIPHSIDTLKSLRYLDISYTRIRILPEAVGKLYSLQFLKLTNTNIRKLPHEFTKLINLRYVDWYLSDYSSLISPSSIGKLTSLQNLPIFVVRDREGYRIEELCYMVHLQGSLRIESLENIKNSEEAAAAKLFNKRLLESLEFEWTSDLSSENNIAEDVLTALEPHKSLRKLRITNYDGHTFPQWLTYLNQLETLYLVGCRFCTILPALGNLASLTYLHIGYMSNLMSLEELFCRSSYDSFPKLKTLVLEQLPQLRQWIRLTSTDLPNLQDLFILGCPELISLPSFKHLSSLVILRIINCEKLDTDECDFPVHLFQAGPQVWNVRDPNIQVVEESTSSEGSNIEKDVVERQKQIVRKPDRWLTLSLVLNAITYPEHRKPNRWATLSLVFKAIVRMRALATKYNDAEPELRRPSRWATLSLVFKAIVRMRALATKYYDAESELRKPSRWATLSLVLKAIVRMRAMVNQKDTPELRKPRGRWDTPSLLVLKAIVRMRVTIMEKYTTKLVNKLIPNYEEKARTKQLPQLTHPLQMMLHCLLFPEDYEFEKKRLVLLWVAAGFLENEPKEDYGNRFFEFLWELSFIITSRNDTLAGTNLYKFNSIKCSSYFEQFGPINHFNKKMDSASVVVNRFYRNWDISVTSSGIDQETFGLLEKFSHLRTILFLNGSLLTKVPSTIFLALKFLRALDLSCSGIKELPESVHHAKQLRYLDLSWTVIERLPDSITDLGELQDLILKGCEHLFQLPKAVNKLTNLRHLDFDVLGQLTSMPEGIGKLVELRTLWAFIVTLVSEDDCNIRELNNMNHLSGKLCISGLENVMKLEDAQSAGLGNKPCLSHLELRWSNIYEENERCNEVVEGLKPNTRLEHLQLICFPGSQFPNWLGSQIGHSYINLVSIMLYRCDNCECLPSLGELPILQKLEILEMNRVEIIDEGFLGDFINQKPFPKLEMLTIDGMQNLKIWDGLNGDNFGSVVNLTIKHCPKLCEFVPSEPRLRSLQHLELVRCPALQSLPDGLLSSSLQTLIIEYCPFGPRYQEGGEDRNKINNEAEVWIFPDVQSSDEDDTEDDASESSDLCNGHSETVNNVANGI